MNVSSDSNQIIISDIVISWGVKSESGQKYLEILTSGVLDKKNSSEMARVIAGVMRKNRLKKALIDHRNVSDVTGDISDIYERPKFFRLIGMFLGIKIAEVIKPEHLNHFKFLETVCLNRGFRFSVFYEIESALNWLLKT